ncbi:hypothetical protein IE53DRAFT_209474 [Violaceomyces palustris]|uniref:Uncharacterized protein n=1 Tax=Violaceomyces palustris TaxID=1673888 RepID=A0ACD0NQU7_9BASI|nr:hypothetical protein IE53DRAFT_209474 [Violaceomyces palustris]
MLRFRAAGAATQARSLSLSLCSGCWLTSFPPFLSLSSLTSPSPLPLQSQSSSLTGPCLRSTLLPKSRRLWPRSTHFLSLARLSCSAPSVPLSPQFLPNLMQKIYARKGNSECENFSQSSAEETRLEKSCG